MEKLEKVELVRDKTGVSYEDARNALEATEYDVLDAIIWLEHNGKTAASTATYETTGTSSQATSYEMQEAQEEYHQSTKRTKFGDVWSKFWAQVTQILNAGMRMTFVAERNGERSVALPVLFVIIGMLVWGASLWLLILGLFFGFRYHIEGADPLTIDVNDAMDKAADAAESLKSDFANKEE